MKMKTTTLLLFVILFLCLQVSLVSATDPIVENADAVWNPNLDTIPTNLTNTTGTALPRPLTEYPNTASNYELKECPEELTDNVSKVLSRPLTEYPNAAFNFELKDIPEELTNTTSKALPRPLIEYANTAFSFSLEESPENLNNTARKTLPRPLVEYPNTVLSKSLIFPKELINDTTPPIITNITVTNITENSATIKWDTDEFADSLVKYGTSSGAYTKQEYDELFVKNHSVSLYNLSSGTEYYFVVKSVDLSGNSAESSEYTFTTSGALNQPPIANFTYYPEKPVVNQSVTFDASSSYDPDGNITSYEWNFGDGNITNTMHEIIKHSYSEVGSYEVTLTVTDNEEAKNSTTKIITVYSGAIFDTGSPRNPYPSIMGTHKGTIKPNHTIIATKLYTYPCPGTGGHTEYARIWNATWEANATWEGYAGEWHNISFDKTVVLFAGETYFYEIRTGSYPQIHHTNALLTANGWINCTEFEDVNGKVYHDWIPAIKLF